MPLARSRSGRRSVSTRHRLAAVAVVLLAAACSVEPAGPVTATAKTTTAKTTAAKTTLNPAISKPAAAKTTAAKTPLNPATVASRLTATTTRPTAGAVKVPTTRKAATTVAKPTTTRAAPTTTRPFTMADTNHAVTTTRFDLGTAPLAGIAGAPSTRWWGVVSVPADGAGPFPLAIVLHGAHSFCDVPGDVRVWPCPAGTEVPNHEGVAYLTDSLARRGFVAIAPGINDEFAIAYDNGTRAFGAVAAAEVARSVDALAAGQASLGVKPGQVDLTHIVLVGHSRGAALAAILGRSSGSPTIGHAAGGVVLLAPSADSVDPNLLADVPTAVVIGSCDGDTGVDGGRFVAPALDVVTRRSPVALLMLDRATHNATNDRLAPEAVPPGRPGCDAPARLDPTLQRQTLAALVPELARATLGASATGDGAHAFNRLRANDQVKPGLRMVHIDPTATRSSLLPKIGQPVPTVGFTPQWCPGGRYSPYRAPGTEPCHRLELEDLVGWPSGLELTWPTPGAAMTVSVPAATVSTGNVLAMRVLVDPADTRVGAGPVALQLEARNGSAPGWSKDVSLAVTPVGTVDTGAYVARRGALLWSEVRLPFDQPATSLTITATSPNAGSLLLVSLEVVTTPR